jgi:transcriptional regulator GlxA family with amidase domain
MISVGLLVQPGFQVLSLACAAVFEMANLSARQTLYEVRTISEEGGMVRASIGTMIETKPCARARLDTLIVVGIPQPAPSAPRVIEFVRRSLQRCRRVSAICTGAFILGEAGLLDGRRATTHWLFARELQQLYPKAHVEEDRIYIIDGSVWTSAGMTAGIDLALGMVEKDFGAELAREVARKMVVYHRRSGGQSQHSALLEMDAKSDRIQNALAYAKRNLRKPLTVEDLAEAVHLSPRQFSRAFRSETGKSPAKAVEHLRLEAARMMIEQTHHPIDVVATETGFADRERMRRAFLRAFGQPPQVIRRNARAEAVGGTA